MKITKKYLFPILVTLAFSSCNACSQNKTTYNVTFNSIGGSDVPSQNIKEGEKVTRPSDPTKEGYTFFNWYKDLTLTNIYDFETPVTSNIYLYAKWSANENQISFNSNGGSNIPSQKVKTGEKATRPKDPIKEGYNFINWFKDETLKNPYDFSTPVTSSFILYAKWIRIEL